MNQETKRKIVHISMVGFALCIGRLPPWMISALCVCAFFFNLLIMPKLTSRALERDADKQRGYALGMLMYPAVLFLLSIIYYKNQVFMAVGWAAMAFGDGFAGVIGPRIGGPRIPWQTEKRWSGMLAFLFPGVPLCLGLLWLLPQETRLGLDLLTWFLVLIPAMALAGLGESIRGTVDDNLIVPLAAAVIASIGAGITFAPNLPSTWIWGLLLVLVLTVGSIASRKIDLPGGIMGGLLAWCIFLGADLPGLLLLFCFFVTGSLASRWGIKDKDALGLAQEDSGRRSVRHAVSNGGVAAGCALIGWFYPEQAPLFAAMAAAALASATADTLSSEMGNLYGKHYINILTLRRDKRGLDGVISLEGTLFGAAGAALIAAVFLATGDISVSVALLIAFAGFAGGVIDSILGASLQRWGFMTNDTVNFANTLAAALMVRFLF